MKANRFFLLLLAFTPLAWASRYQEDLAGDGAGGYVGAGRWWEYALFLPFFWFCWWLTYQAIARSGKYWLWTAAALAVGTYMLINVAGPFYVALSTFIAFLMREDKEK